MERDMIIVSDYKDSVLTKELWQEVFAEDSAKFVNYYFSNKVPGNKVFAILDQEGTNLCAMLHLTKYVGVLNEKEHEVHYIVGVATKERYRHQGFMKEMLIKALQSMSKKEEPYTFLMPANPKIYEPFGFSYIYDRPVLSLNKQVLSEKMLAFVAQTGKSSHILHKEYGRIELSVLHNEDKEELIEFSNGYLNGHYQVYMKRTLSYYNTLQKELYSENGNIFILKDEGRIIGFFMYAKENNIEFIQEAIIKDEYKRFQLFVEEKERKPIIMARILDLEQFGQYLVPSNNVMLTIRVLDSLISKNEGIFLFNGSKITKIQNDSSKVIDSAIKVEFEISINQLTEVLFGYKEDKRFQGIPTLSGVFINEIV
ncbi:MAG TPA: GNAT family N-acetyltransferase [Lachnospiraceae bacterium]|nr:GNAT family N-acetyltransferase [Lachnospiraceae bacterium]